MPHSCSVLTCWKFADVVCDPDQHPGTLLVVTSLHVQLRQDRRDNIRLTIFNVRQRARKTARKFQYKNKLLSNICGVSSRTRDSSETFRSHRKTRWELQSKSRSQC